MKYNFKSYTFWMGIISAILMIVKTLFNIDFDAEYVNEIVTTILGALVVAGIINSPNAGQHNYTDDTTHKKEDELIDKK